MLKNKPFWFTVALIAAYLLTAYLAVPTWLQPRLEQYVMLQSGRQLQVEKLQFDPLTWSVTLTGVQLAFKPAIAGEQELFPDIRMTAESVHLRFNFWRLRAAVSTLIVKAPTLSIDGNSKLMLPGPYPFVSQWQLWRSANNMDTEHQTVPVRRWRLEEGRMELGFPGTQKPDKVLLDELLFQADRAKDAGHREYRLAFESVNGSAINMQGQLHVSPLSSEGQYQWKGTLPQEDHPGIRQGDRNDGALPGASEEFNAAGAFSISAPDDFLRIELAQSQMNANQFERCELNGLLCARIYPLRFSFSATLQAATDGIRLLSAKVQQAAFEGDASMAQGAVVLNQQLAFESAELNLNALPESPIEAGTELLTDTLELDLTLQTTDALSLNVRGQYHPDSEKAFMRFTTHGSPEFRGELQWQRIAAQQATAPYPQLELRLENPAASLAQNFMGEHLSGQVEAEALQLQLLAKQNEQELSITRTVRLEQVSLSPTLLPPKIPSTAPQSAPTSVSRLDAAWLLALLQNPQSNVELAIPEQKILLTERPSLQSLVQAPILAHLNRVVSQPFEALASQMGDEGEHLAAVQFESGSAELNTNSSKSLTVLAEVLLQRPGLGIGLAGVYDPVIDMRALQVEQIRTHIALATAADSAFQTGSKPPDFNDPTVHSVIDEFARRRLPDEVRKAFAGHFGEADVDRGVIPEGDVASYYETLSELLVDYADVPQGALSTLARYRAQAVLDLLARQGVVRDRIETAEQPLISAAELTGVPLNLELRIHTVKNPELPEDGSSGELDNENQEKL